MDPKVPWIELGRPSKEFFMEMMRVYFRGKFRLRGEKKEHALNLYDWVQKGGFWPSEDVKS